MASFASSFILSAIVMYPAYSLLIAITTILSTIIFISDGYEIEKWSNNFAFPAKTILSFTLPFKPFPEISSTFIALKTDECQLIIPFAIDCEVCFFMPETYFRNSS